MRKLIYHCGCNTLRIEEALFTAEWFVELSYVLFA